MIRRWLYVEIHRLDDRYIRRLVINCFAYCRSFSYRDRYLEQTCDILLTFEPALSHPNTMLFVVCAYYRFKCVIELQMKLR